jgi:hypothetical protein
VRPAKAQPRGKARSSDGRSPALVRSGTIGEPDRDKEGGNKKSPSRTGPVLRWVVHGGLKDYLGATLLLTFVPALCPNPTFAQSINSGTVSGTVKILRAQSYQHSSSSGLNVSAETFQMKCVSGSNLMAHYRAIIWDSERPFAASNLMSRISQNGNPDLHRSSA